MTQFFLIALAHAVVTSGVAIVWLVRSYLKLKNNYQVLLSTVQGNSKDIADLYSSAVTTESRLVTANEQLRALSAQISAVQQVKHIADPYSTIIHKVRNGANIDDLMRDCNLCRDEAVLLIRLHGSNK
ncbi:MAG: DUF2802 domain-containing protein [Methylosarcina sp.]